MGLGVGGWGRAAGGEGRGGSGGGGKGGRVGQEGLEGGRLGQGALEALWGGAMAARFMWVIINTSSIIILAVPVPLCTWRWHVGF